MRLRCFLLLFLVCLVGYGDVLSGARLLERAKVSGFDTMFTVRDGVAVYDSQLAMEEKKFRWATMSIPAPDGDFCAKLSYSIERMDHWNALGLVWSSKEQGAFSFGLYRAQDNVGTHLLKLEILRKGTATVKESVPYAGRMGALTIRRKGTSLILEGENETGMVIPVKEVTDVPKGEAFLRIHGGTPAVTEAIIQLKKLELTGFARTTQLSGKNLLTQLEASGHKEAFVEENGVLTYDSTLQAHQDKYRWAKLSLPTPSNGAFAATLDFKIIHIDHWNSFGLMLNSTQKDAFSVNFRRMQAKPGEHFLRAQVSIAGREIVKKDVPFASMAGSLTLRRVGKRVQLEGQDEKGTSVPVVTLEDVPEGDARLFLAFDTPPLTGANVQLVNLSLEGFERLAKADSPQFGMVCQAAPVEILGGEGVTVKDGVHTIVPGGKLMLAVNAPRNIQTPQLAMTSSGALKVAVFQFGNHEPTVTGEYLVWDLEPQPKEPKERVFSLSQYLSRYPLDRKWSYPLITFSPCLLFEVTPADDQPVTVVAPEFRGRLPIPAEPLEEEGLTVAKWNGQELKPLQPKASIALSGVALPFRTGERFAGFQAVSLKLDETARVFSVPVNDQFASLDVLTACGKQAPNDSTVPAALQFLYDDGSNTAEYFTLRWNTGVLDSSFIPRGMMDHTWYGPVGFPRAEMQFLPTGNYHEAWNGVYRTHIVNPFPKKTVERIVLHRMPGSHAEFALLGLKKGGRTLASIEPDDCALQPGKPLTGRVFAWSSTPAALPTGTHPLKLCRAAASVKVGEVTFVQKGEFSCAQFRFTIPTNAVFAAGDAWLEAAGIRSPRLGVLPDKTGEFHYSMIAGCGYSQADFERIRRIGYDCVKLVTTWEEEKEGEVKFPLAERWLKRTKTAGLKWSFRNQIHSTPKIPEYFKKKGVFQTQYFPDKEPKPTFQADLADPWTVSRIINLYRVTARIAKDTNCISINVNYGLRPGVGPKCISMGAASLAQLRKTLAAKYTVAQVNQAAGTKYKSMEELQPIDLYHDESGFLLREYLLIQQQNIATVQRAVCQAIREEGYQGHLTLNVNFHPVEQVLLGFNTSEYLKLSREFLPASIFHESSDRYSLSFTKWLSAKRTLNLPYGDEGCLTPPPELANRIAYIWMDMMQCWDSLTCQWFAGKPGMLDIAHLRAIHALLYDAQYLPDDFALAFSFRTAEDEAHKTIRRGLHESPAAHYSLASTLRALNLNADRYLIDDFPELDANVHSKLLIDDITRSVRPDFATRLETFMRQGGVFVASVDTDSIHDHAFLKKFGVHPDRVPNDGVAEIPVGKGKLVFWNGTWNNQRWDPGMSEETHARWNALFTRLGGFRPLVKTDRMDVFATPYRAPNGDLLIHLVNRRADSGKVHVSWRKDLAGTTLYDHATGRSHPATAQGDYCTSELEIVPFDATVLRIPAK